MSPLFPVPKPLPKVGKVAQRRAPFYAEQKGIVKTRCRGLCEGCGCSLRLNGGGDIHHVFGRPGTGARLGWWADCAELLAAICRQCHDRITDGKASELDDRLRRQAIERFALRIEVVPLDIVEGRGGDLVGAVREMVAIAQEIEAQRTPND